MSLTPTLYDSSCTLKTMTTLQSPPQSGAPENHQAAFSSQMMTQANLSVGLTRSSDDGSCLSWNTLIIPPVHIPVKYTLLTVTEHECGPNPQASSSGSSGDDFQDQPLESYHSSRCFIWKQSGDLWVSYPSLPLEALDLSVSSMNRKND